MKQRLATVGLAAFLLADIGLVALALRQPSAPETSPTSVSATPRPTRTPTAQPAPTPTTTTPVYAVHPLTLTIVGIDGRRAWRATGGTCANGGALVQTTSDGGRTWTKGTKPAQAIARVQPLDGGRGFVYGSAGKDCALREFMTSDGGQTWQGPGAASGVWARQLGQPHVVVAPQAPASRPCGDDDVLDLARSSGTNAEALCRNGDVKQTLDGGATWSDWGSVPGGLALSTRADRDGVTAIWAVRPASVCKGLEVVRVLARGGNPSRSGCVPTTTVPKPGQVSISTVPEAGWVAVGGETWTSPDLRAWKKA